MQSINGAGHGRSPDLPLVWGNIDHHGIWIQEYLPAHFRAGEHQASPVLDTKLLQLPGVGFTGMTQSLCTNLLMHIA
ncbi:hypothetical protein D3C76_1398980 [compost metagenome]